jgi:hypothetical protein
MDELVAAALAARGFLSTGDLLRHLDRATVDRLVGLGELERVRGGMYVDGRRFTAADPVTRHVMTARAVAGLLGSGYAVSHLSAVALHGLPVLRSDLGKVHVSLVGAGKCRSDDRLQVYAALPSDLVVDVGGTPAVAPAVAVVQSAASAGIRAGVVAADAALAGRVTRDDLEAALGVARVGRGRRAAARVVDMADGCSESPGESWTRLVLTAAGLPTPELQALIQDETGSVVARVDFLFPAQRVVVEFDGAVKYGGAAQRGQLALIAEKRREDAIRRLGFVVVRLTWGDLSSPERVRALVLAAMRTAAA